MRSDGRTVGRSASAVGRSLDTLPRRIPSDTDADFESDPPREGPAGRADRLGGEEPGKARHGMGGRVVTAAGVTE